MPLVKVERIPVGEMGTNCYIVENAETGACVIVDPGADAERIIRQAGGRRPEAVLLTHGHFDHIGALDEVCAHYGIPVYVHEADADKLADPVANVSAPFGARVVQHTQPTLVRGGDTITAAGIPFAVLHTPGHTKGGVCYQLPDGQGVLTGDTLFAHGYGRTDFADGDFALLVASLRVLFRLSPKQPCYPGHDAVGWVGRDGQSNGE